MVKDAIKCIVWDLDNTIWDGTLIEGDACELKPQIKKLIQELDSKGILQSIASKNNYDVAWSHLKKHRLEEYFLFPQINWNAKSDSIKYIRDQLNIGFDTLLFIDDSAFERKEVISELPEVLCLDAKDYLDLPNHKRIAASRTTEGAQRRLSYKTSEMRRKEELTYVGPKLSFLKSLNMKCLISNARIEDLDRAEELLFRTNQLNATGITYSRSELEKYMSSSEHALLMCSLEDRFGSYGKVGLALLEKNSFFWKIKLILMSCRVLSYGLGAVLLGYIRNLAIENQVQLKAEFRDTGKNEMMYATFKFNGFEDESQENSTNITTLKYVGKSYYKIPDYLQVTSYE